MQFFIDSVLYSYAQIFFSNRKWFGLIVLCATFIVPEIGLAALLGVVLVNLTAYTLKFDLQKIGSGFYGFNGILFGAGTAFYYEVTPFLLVIILLFIVITFFITAVLEHYLASAFNLPGLSLPFIVSLYIFIIFLTNYDFILTKTIKPFELHIFDGLPIVVQYYFKSISLILFQPSIITGLIIAVGLLLFSRVLFIISIIAFALNCIFLSLLFPHQTENFIILSGLNTILTGFALGGSLIIPSRKSFLLVILGTLMIIIITGFFVKIFSGTILPVLVLPFNFIVLTTIYSLKFRKDQTDIVLLYFPPGNPEENYYYHHNRRARFDKFKYVFPELPVFGEWYVSQGFNGEYTHKDEWKYAWDFVVVDGNNKQYSNNGDVLSDYYCYKLPVIAPLDGEVVKISDGIPDNQIGTVNTIKNWGNTIIIKHEYGLYSAISHLYSGSFKVKPGDRVKKGDLIAQCGNSGRSPYPHIHFQFQVSDKIGEKTHLFPFSNLIEKHTDCLSLKTFDYPVTATRVQNLETHKPMKKAFDFGFGNKFEFNYERDGIRITENWEVKIDMNSSTFIESSEGDIAYFYLTDKVFYFYSYSGQNKSSLYYFNLIGMQVPLSYHKKMCWSDTYSVAHLKTGITRYLSEFLLFYKGLLSAKGNFRFEETPDEVKDYIIASEIKLEGSGIFSLFKNELNGKLVIDPDGFIKEITVYENNKLVFSARKAEKEKE
jgi:urea transporter/murein DD-endopeptidase MepM/ murein hydrolase activator NlpD